MNQHAQDYGLGVRSHTTGTFSAFSKSIRPNVRTPTHDHTTASASVLLHGRAEEELNGKTWERCPGRVHINPAGQPHALNFAPEPARSIVVEFDPRALEHTTRLGESLEEPMSFLSQTTLLWGVRIQRLLVYGAPEERSAGVEEAIYELLSTLVTTPCDRNGPPVWLRRTHQRLTEVPEEAVSIGELAVEAGVDAAHLAREFRRHYGTTPSTYRRERRLDLACATLLEGNITIAEAAALAGFADQSHFGRELRRRLATTPRALKHLFR